MRNPQPRQPVDDLAELRRLINQPERDKRRELHDRLDDREQRAHEVAAILPEAVTLSGDRSEALTRALRPAVEGSVRESIEKHPEAFIDALHPIIGSVVRRSIAESLRTLLQTLNQSLEQSFSWQGLKWRFEALRTGRPFSEIVMLRSLIYRVEHIFLFHRETSLALLQVSAPETAAQDSDMLAGMLSAIQDFARDGLKSRKDASIADFRMDDDVQVWVAPGPRAYLAAVIRGNPPRELRTRLEETIERIHTLRSSALAKFNGDATQFESLRPELESCLREQRQPKNTSRTNRRAWFALAAGAGLIVATLIVGVESEMRWRDFVRRLNGAPGIAVTQAEKGWISKSRVAFLRDPAVADPAALARAAGINPERVRFEWKDYLALDDASVLRRFEKRFGKPAGTKLGLTNGALTISGNVPYEWFVRVQQDGIQSPGITSIAEKDVHVTYDPDLAVGRFRRAFPLPPGVNARVENGTLLLAGTAPYEWLEPVRENAVKLPGIGRISEEHLQVAYDAKRVLQRFSDRFNLPDTVNATMRDGILVLSGEAAHAWLMRVRRDAPTVPRIKTIDEHSLTDLDSRGFQQSKAPIQSAFVFIFVSKDNFATEDLPRSRVYRMKSAAVSPQRTASASRSRSRCAVLRMPSAAGPKMPI
jgi:OOP family OmpA-OmpF porin